MPDDPAPLTDKELAAIEPVDAETAMAGPPIAQALGGSTGEMLNISLDDAPCRYAGRDVILENAMRGDYDVFAADLIAVLKERLEAREEP